MQWEGDSLPPKERYFKDPEAAARLALRRAMLRQD
jgi:hypothetical protein